MEREGYDRVNITLPGVQPQFIEAILATGTPTVLVLINGGSVAIDKLATDVPAIVEAFYPGYFGAPAMASVLMGDYNPGGKLPVTMYESSITTEANFLDMDIAHPPGRTYRFFTGTPSFPFGHGLSYTTFTITWNSEKAEPESLWTGAGHLPQRAVSSTTYTAKVTNTGDREGDEVVFLFIKPQEDVDAVHGPPPAGADPGDLPLIKQLAGFQRVHLAAGDSTTVTFTVDANTLAMPRRGTGRTVACPGTYTLEVTNGVDQVAATDVFMVGEELVLDSTVENAILAIGGRPQ